MPNLTPKKPGDNFYPQLQRVTTEPISSIAVTKGRLYTKGSGASGNQLVAAGATGFLRGIYQATRDVPAGTAGANRVQCFGPGTRIALPAKVAELHAGDLLKYDTTNHNVELWTGSSQITTNEYAGRIGRIFKIYSRDDITVEKDVTAIGDIVIVDVLRG